MTVNISTNIVTTENSGKEGKVSPVKPASSEVGKQDAQRHRQSGHRTQPAADFRVAAFAHLKRDHNLLPTICVNITMYCALQ